MKSASRQDKSLGQDCEKQIQSGRYTRSKLDYRQRELVAYLEECGNRVEESDLSRSQLGDWRWKETKVLDRQVARTEALINRTNGRPPIWFGTVDG